MKAWCVKRGKKIDGGRGENVTMSYKMLQHTCMSRPAFNNFGGNYLVPYSDIMLVSGRGWGEATRPGTEKRCSHNLQSDPVGSGFKKGRENFPL